LPGEYRMFSLTSESYQAANKCLPTLSGPACQPNIAAHPGTTAGA
jgi:hypothetical protein